MSKPTADTLQKDAEAVAQVLYTARGIATPRHYTAAIIAAAGNSSRMGGALSKQRMLLRGMPVLAHTLLAYQKADTIHEIVIVGKAQDFDAYREMAKEHGITKLRVLCEGGASRQESVLCGLKQVSKRTKYVAIADGARCLITPQQIEAVCHAAYRTGAATAATPATDTVKVADNMKFIEQTPDRSTMWLAQTPQVFDYTLYHAAAYYALEQGFSATDDNSLVEFINRRVKLVDCGRENIKITTPVDLLIADAILQARESQEASKEDNSHA